MKPVLLMKLSHCPHCRRALAMMEELFETHPDYRAIPLKIVDEAEEAEFAASLDYYYVPTFYVGNEKVHEGVPTEAAVAAVFERAMKES